MKPRVFLLMEPNVDVRKAREFGEVVVLFPEGEERPGIWDPELYAETVRRLEVRRYRPHVDYWLVAGSMAPVTMAVGALMDWYSGYRPQALVFDGGPRRDYVVVRLGCELLDEEDEEGDRDERDCSDCIQGGSDGA